MNVICNSCVGARMYELLNMEYTNPFMWNVVPYDDFRFMMMNYKAIDFSSNMTELHTFAEKTIAVTTFDTLIRAYYIHYFQDDSCKGTERREAINIFSNDIIGYTEEKVRKRTERMLKANEEPIFIFETRSRPYYDINYSQENIDDFIQLDVPYKKVLLTEYETFKDADDLIGNTHVLYFREGIHDRFPRTELMAKRIYEKFP